MKTTKLSLANIKGKLSRQELKNIMAGSNPYTCLTGEWCSDNSQCNYAGGYGCYCYRSVCG